MNKLSLLLLAMLAACTPKPLPTATTEKISAPATSSQPAKEDPGPEDVSGVPTDMQSIKKAYAYIITQRERNAFDSNSFDISCGENNGTVKYFFEGSDLRLIDCNITEGEYLTVTERYFLKDTTLFFVYTGNDHWSYVSGNGTRNMVNELRTYILNRQPVKCLGKTYEINSDKDDTPPENMPNKETDCTSFEKMDDDYHMWLRFWADTNECPERYNFN